MIKVLSFVLFCFFPLIVYAVDPYSFSVSEFEYEKAKKPTKIENVGNVAKPDSISIDGGNMVINTESIYVIQKGNIGQLDTHSGVAKEINKVLGIKKTSPLRMKALLSYWVAADNDWQKALNPVILAEYGVVLPEIPTDLFVFSLGASLSYRLSLSKDKYNFYFHSLSLILPLNFRFYIAEKYKLTFSVPIYYEFQFMLYEDEFHPKSFLEQNVFGIRPSVSWLMNLNKDMDIGIEITGIIPFTRKAFYSVSAGTVLEWRI